MAGSEADDEGKSKETCTRNSGLKTEDMGVTLLLSFLLVFLRGWGWLKWK